MSIDVRHPTDDERERLHLLSERTFRRRPAAYDPEGDRAAIPLERRLVATVDGEIVGKLGVWKLGQWFGERCVPTGGVAGVAVEPAFRGRGVATALLRTALENMRDRGEALATLFPMNHTLYRRRGWEIGGACPEHEVPTQLLTTLPAPSHNVDLRPAETADLPTLLQLHDRVARREPGNLAYGPEFAASRLLPAGVQEAYVAAIDGTPTGSVTFTKADSRDGIEWYSLTVRHFAALDLDTELALWRLLGSYRPVVRTVRYIAPQHATLPHFLGEREIRPTNGGWAWMTRFVDVQAAIGARGYPNHVDVTVDLDIRDDFAPWNSGRKVLRVKGGTGSLESGGTGRVRVEVGHLASMYTGWADPARLARWGYLPGAVPADVDALRACFSGPTPWLPVFF